MLVGSCFTEHIGQWLQEAWLPVMCNPWGVLFNPASIAGSLWRVRNEECGSVRSEEFGNAQGADSEWPELHELNGRYYSFDHHGKWSGADPVALRQQLVELEQEAAGFLASAKHVVVTFGTSWVYEREDRIVANCHKFPASEFVRRKLSVEEIVSMWSEVIEALTVLPLTSASQALNAEPLTSEKRTFTFTVSPIRHVKDTLHGNQLSKATLLLAIDELQRRYPDRVQYLPVYELLMDDLRDYRFYADDLVHPSSMAVEAVKELFTECAMTPALRQYMKEAAPIVRGLQHRPTDPDSEQYKAFVADLMKKKERLVQLTVSNPPQLPSTPL